MLVPVPFPVLLIVPFVDRIATPIGPVDVGHNIHKGSDCQDLDHGPGSPARRQAMRHHRCKPIPGAVPYRPAGGVNNTIAGG
ncbi:MAG: hypothetical protein KatS3mg104_3186 [Phycisphaerae bacterium]|nr:MAG: hypothetical protein KatS3mg104_3186 [Phycisphaerae bacterium]